MYFPYSVGFTSPWFISLATICRNSLRLHVTLVGKIICSGHVLAMAQWVWGKSFALSSTRSWYVEVHFETLAVQVCCAPLMNTLRLTKYIPHHTILTPLPLFICEFHEKNLPKSCDGCEVLPNWNEIIILVYARMHVARTKISSWLPWPIVYYATRTHSHWLTCEWAQRLLFYVLFVVVDGKHVVFTVHSLLNSVRIHNAPAHFHTQIHLHIHTHTQLTPTSPHQ